MRIRGRKLGAITRLFAPESKLVGNIVAANVSLFDRLFTTTDDGQPFVQNVQALIPINPLFPSHCDCGETRRALIEAIRGYWWADRVSILMSKRDDPFGSLPNYGMHQLDQLGCDWGLMIAPEAGEYWDQELVSNVSHAADEGASIIGLGIPGLEELTEAGIVSNRLAVWNIGRLVEAGGFFPISSPLIAPHVPPVFTGRHGNQEHAYARVGGEEGVTSLLMAGLQARIAILKAKEGITQTPRDPKRFAAMMSTKAERTHAAIQATKLSVGDLRAAIM